MITTSMIMHQWLRINGMVTPDANVYSAMKQVARNDPLNASPQKCVVAEVTT